MRRSCLIPLLISLLALTSMVAADPLYKWVDDQGNVHYSDKPQPGAKKITLPKATTFVAPKVVQPAPLPDATQTQPAGPQPYTQIIVSAPKDQDTVWNTDTVTVGVALTPALQPGDTVTISVDGSSQTVAATSATFTGLERGEHAVTATVNGPRGTSLTTQSVFYLQHATVKKPPL